MKVVGLDINFRKFNGCELLMGKCLTAIAGNNGTGKSTILGLLANSSQLRKHKPLLGKSYRGEFSELFRASQDHDPSGQTVRMSYVEHGVEMEASFRTAWQSGPRFRVIPRRKRLDGTRTESKIESPVIYLGLSRLYPIGEADSNVSTRGYKWKNAEEIEWFDSNYAHILSVHDEIKAVSSISIDGLSAKRGTGIATDTYGPTTNSAGQDNLGQILLAILSFKELREEMGDSWDGGLLLVDELDAALHPAAQIRLAKLLFDECRELGFQAVFTTHSTTLLRWMTERNQHNPDESPGKIEVCYLTDASGRLEAKRNPSWETIENGLLVLNPALNARTVGVFTEDAEARWMLRELLKVLVPDVMGHIDLIDVKMGCGVIVNLYSADFAYFRDRVVVLDGDVGDEELERIPEAVRKSGGNMLRLPGSARPESVIWEYLRRKPEENSAIWADLDRVGISWASLVETPPDRFNGGDERSKYKEWLKTYENYFSRAHVMSHWITDNQEEAESFKKGFLKAYNRVAQRTMAPLVPMGER